MSHALWAALDRSPRPIEVAGEGPLADEVRTRLEAEPAPPGERPGTIVDTTGDPAEIERALSRVRDLGAVVLAAALGPPDAELDLYSDLHVRGLTLVGVSDPAAAA